MAWLIAALVFGVAGITWLVAEGRFGELADHVDDRPMPTLPAGDLAADDLAAVRFATVPRGYHPGQVKAFLRRVGSSLTAPVAEPATDAVAAEDGGGQPPVTALEVQESSFDLVAFGLSTGQVDNVLARLAHQLSRPAPGGEPPTYGRMDDEHLPGDSEEVHTWQQ